MNNSNLTLPEEILKTKEVMGHLLNCRQSLPISFTYDGELIHGIPKNWLSTTQNRRIDSNIIERIHTGRDINTGLEMRVECLEYQDYPVVEWVAWLTNYGNSATPIIENLLITDVSFSGKIPTISHSNGDFYSKKGYESQETVIKNQEQLKITPTGGRPCDGAFPYLRVKFEEYGMTVAIGWPGQWMACFNGTENGLHMKCGQELTHLSLLSGEKIRTPRMTVLVWKGNESRSVNLWRRWYFAHILPKPNGNLISPKLTGCGTDEGEEFTAATEDNQIKYIEKNVKQGIKNDVWWIDAGWYPCMGQDGKRHWTKTGDWVSDEERFPNGFKPISDLAAKNGTDLLIWFEPERIEAGTKLDIEHPEWLLKTKKESNFRLLNLGNSECREWLTNHIDKLIKDNGIKIYRQDFNIEPLNYWRDNEESNRSGINENLHVQGYLQYWDDLLDRNPGLWIDSCASGGRRNDLETMRRSVPLHYTDFGYGDLPVKVAFQHLLFEWLPYFKEFTLCWDNLKVGETQRFDNHADMMGLYCGIAPMLFVSSDIKRDDYDIEKYRKMIEIWRKVAPMLYGDYYPLTPYSKSNEKWVVRQFDDTNNKTGFILAIRHSACEENACNVKLKAINPNAVYYFENAETGQKIEIDGKLVDTEGFTFSIPKHSGEIWTYK